MEVKNENQRVREKLRGWTKSWT